MPSRSMIPRKGLFEPSPEPWKPHEYQRRATRFLLEHACAALLLEPGLGKSSVTLAAIQFLKRRSVLKKVLLIAPLRVCFSVWPNEIRKWADFHDLRAVVLHGKDRDEALATQADIYVINPDGLTWLFGAKASGELDKARWRSLGFDTLVVDELTKFKHTRTARFKLIKQVLGSFARRWGLTGSPAANGLLDLFGQCYVLDEGRSLGRFISHYRMQYFTPSFHGFTWTIRPGADEEIYERIRPLALRMSAEEYLELPELVENVIGVDLPEGARKVYDDLERDLIAKIDDGTVVAANAAAASSKCRQVANGGVYFDVQGKDREWSHLHTAKVEALLDLIEELQGQPLLVAYEFLHDLERLQMALGKKVPYIGGGVTPKRAAELEQLWNVGKLPVLLGHPQSIAHGLNLQGAGHHVCWHSLTWNYEHYDQFIRRVWRQGSKASRVIVHHIIARNTVDETVLGALKRKERGQEALFAALKKRAEK